MTEVTVRRPERMDFEIKRPSGETTTVRAVLSDEPADLPRPDNGSALSIACARQVPLVRDAVLISERGCYRVLRLEASPAGPGFQRASLQRVGDE